MLCWLRSQLLRPRWRSSINDIVNVYVDEKEALTADLDTCTAELSDVRLQAYYASQVYEQSQIKLAQCEAKNDHLEWCYGDNYLTCPFRF